MCMCLDIRFINWIFVHIYNVYSWMTTTAVMLNDARRTMVNTILSATTFKYLLICIGGCIGYHVWHLNDASACTLLNDCS